MKRLTASMLITLLLACYLPPAAAAAEFEGPSEYFGDGGYVYNKESRVSSKDIEDLQYLDPLRPGTEIFLNLRAKDFDWDDSQRHTLTPWLLERIGAPSFENLEGDHVLESVRVEWRGEQPGLLMRFKRSHKSFEPEDFRAEVCFAGTSFTLAGTISNTGVSVGRYTTSVQLGPGRYAQALVSDAIGVTFKLGEGVSVYADLPLQEKAYGEASAFVYAEDRALMQKYPQILHVLRPFTINLSGRVLFDQSLYGDLYVYDRMLNLLGTTAESHPMTGTYYLCAEKL